MVIINNEPIDHLPYIDDIVTSDERANVERLVINELETQTNQSNNELHPLVEQMLPLRDNNENNMSKPLLIQEIERYEQEQDDEDIDETSAKILQDGIDMSKYSEFTTTNASGREDIRYDNLYATLSYSLLQNRDLSLLSQNEQQLIQLQEHHISDLETIEEEYRQDLSKKRQRIEEINVLRKRRQVVDFKPVNDYLNDRWKDGIKSVVELGIEAKRMDMDMH
mmetsp:Transcript_1751/g.1901  ORF Transcript_1751/g.1901 Transcript_1751/m.1901 type:complete len:223 (-) Transcript_1751:705-1373(-)